MSYALLLLCKYLQIKELKVLSWCWMLRNGNCWLRNGTRGKDWLLFIGICGIDWLFCRNNCGMDWFMLWFCNWESPVVTGSSAWLLSGLLPTHVEDNRFLNAYTIHQLCLRSIIYFSMLIYVQFHQLCFSSITYPNGYSILANLFSVQYLFLNTYSIPSTLFKFYKVFLKIDK